MADITPTKIVVSVLLFVALILGGFSIYTGVLTDNSINYSTNINETAINNFKDKAINISDTIEDNKKSAPPILGLDIITTGFSAVESVFGANSLISEIVSFIRLSTPLKFIPKIYTDILIAIIFVIVIFAIISVFWRYKT